MAASDVYKRQPVIKFTVRFRQKLAHIKSIKRKNILLMNENSIGADLQGQNGGERIQVVENDQIERRCRNKYDVF